MRITEKAKNAALQTAIGQGLHYLEKIAKQISQN